MSVLLQKRVRTSTMASAISAGSRPDQKNTTVLTSANTSAVLHLSLETNPTFINAVPLPCVQSSSLRIHMASFHGEKLQSVYPDSCRPDGGAGNLGDRKGVGSRDSARSFVCDVCRKAFFEASHLKRHKRIHTGHKDKPFVMCAVRLVLLSLVA